MEIYKILEGGAVMYFGRCVDVCICKDVCICVTYFVFGLDGQLLIKSLDYLKLAHKWVWLGPCFGSF